MDFVTKSYSSHQASYDAYAANQPKNACAKTWLEANNLNNFRCAQMYQLSDPFLTLYPNTRWLTIGDGRYGCDAQYLQKKGAVVLPSDISDVLLKEAKNLGLINDYSTENAEHLSFDAEQFDFVYCKESYHHFPRPALALYEMLRVVKRGVVLLEPLDREIVPIHQRIFLSFKNTLKRFLGKPVMRHVFEEDGNYLFSVSKREFEKIALGLGFRHIIFKGINDIYFPGMECAQIDAGDATNKKWRRKQAFYDFFSKLGLVPYNLLFAAFVKQPLSDTEILFFKAQGYEVVELPQNPYL